MIRQLLTESILVAALGGILEAFLAAWGTDLLLVLVSGGGCKATTASFFSRRRLRCLPAFYFGLAPALRATRLDVNSTLAANVRGASGSRGGVRTGRMLVVAQVALSLLLLMGATLFGRTLHNLAVLPLGYNRDHILMARVDTSIEF